MNQDEIKISARMLRRWYDTEKKKILADLNREFFAKQKELTEMCKSIGHDFVNLPNNGINQPHFITGEWPKQCRYCGVSK